MKFIFSGLVTVSLKKWLSILFYISVERDLIVWLRNLWLPEAWSIERGNWFWFSDDRLSNLVNISQAIQFYVTNRDWRWIEELMWGIHLAFPLDKIIQLCISLVHLFFLLPVLFFWDHFVYFLISILYIHKQIINGKLFYLFIF